VVALTLVLGGTLSITANAASLKNKRSSTLVKAGKKKGGNKKGGKMEAAKKKNPKGAWAVAGCVTTGTLNRQIAGPVPPMCIPACFISWPEPQGWPRSAGQR
jgi:hypothetical protein